MHGFYCYLKMYTRSKIEYINKNNIVVEIKLIHLWWWYQGYKIILIMVESCYMNITVLNNFMN